MELINYQDFNVHQILSKQKNPNKRNNFCLINSKYYFQIPNQLEDLQDDDQLVPYSEEIEVIEEGEYARIVNLQDLYKICLQFQLDEDLIYVLIFQFLNFLQMSDDFIIHQQQSNKVVLEFIQEHGIQIVYNSIDANIKYNLRNVEQVKQQIYKNFAHYYLIHPSIINAHFSPVDFKKIKTLILENRAAEITKEEQDRFLDWIYLLDYQLITHNTIFDNDYNLQQDDIWSMQDIQDFLAKSQNNLKVNQNLLQSYKDYRIIKIQSKPTEVLFILKDNAIIRSKKVIDYPSSDNTDNNQTNNASEQEEQIKYEYFPYLYNLYLQNTKLSKSPKVLLNSHQSEKKVFVEMRLKEKQKYRLATRNQSIDQGSYLFATSQQQMTLTPKIIESVQEQIATKDSNLTFLYLDMKDFNYNIDYDIVDKIFNLPDLANYLKEREIWYTDPVTKKEEKLDMHKGIIIGEPFHDIVAQCMSFFIQDILSYTIDIVFKYKLEVKKSSIYNYNDDFLIEMTHSSTISQKEILKQLSALLKQIDLRLKDVGMILNKKKLQILNSYQGLDSAWKVDKNFQFIECNEFLLFEKNLMETFCMKEQANPQVQSIVNKLILDIQNNKYDYDLILKALTPLQLCFYIEFIDQYLQEIQPEDCIVKGILHEAEYKIFESIGIKNPIILKKRSAYY